MEVSDGLYRVPKMLTPGEVCLRVYGNLKQLPVLLEENPDCTWQYDDVVVCPNKKGRTGEPIAGDSVTSFIKRVYPGQPPHEYVQGYLQWNAHMLPNELVGETLFIPAIR